MRLPAWRVILLVGVVVTVATAVAGPELQPLLVQLAIVAGLVAAWRKVRPMPAASRRAWSFMLAGGSLIFIGGNVRAVHALLADVETPFPSVADLFNFAGYASFVAGAFEFLRRRSYGAKDYGAWVDALIVTAAAGVCTWVLLLDQNATDASVPIEQRLVNIAYSMASLAILAVATRVIQAPGSRPRPYYLFGGAVALFVASDYFTTYEYTHGLEPHVALILIPAIYALFVSAVHHPEVTKLTENPPDDEPGLSNSRLVLLAVAQLIPPMMLLLSLGHVTSTSRMFMLAATFLMTTLVLVRLTILIRARDSLVQRGVALRRTAELLAETPSVTDIYAIGARSAATVCKEQLIGAALILEETGPFEYRVAAEHPPRSMDQEADGVLRAWLQSGSDLNVGEVEVVQSKDGGSTLAATLIQQVPKTLLVTESAAIPDRHDRQALVGLAREVGFAHRGVRLVEQRTTRRYEALVTKSSDIVAVLDETGMTVYVSPAVEVLGCPPQELLNKPFGELVDPRDRHLLSEMIGAVAASVRNSMRAEVRLSSKTSIDRWFDLNVEDRRADPDIAGLVLNARDISERREAEAKLRQSEARFKALVQHSSDLVAVLDEEGQFIYVSPSSLPLLGVASADLLGENALEFIDPEHREQVAERVVNEVAGTRVPQHIELQAVSVDGHPLILDATITDLRHDPAVGGIVINARDITVSHKLESDLRFAAYHDSLTGLPNRLLLMKKIEETRSDDTIAGIALLFVDLDDFKTINDGLGHAVGDEVLNLVASRLRTVLRLRDTAARLGGDEFAILLTECYSEDDVLTLAERVLAAITEPIDLADRELHITASIGVSVAWGDRPSPTTMLRDADAAMYKAKQAGKNRAELFESSLQETAIERLELSSDLRTAIEGDEMFLVYQPIIDLDTEAIVGLEALVRWQHPTRGVLGPGSFIELAEQTGLIVPLGRWVLREACRQLAEWDVAGIAAPVMSVNLSARQLSDGQLIEDITGSLQCHGIGADRLCIEVTESLLIDETEFTMQRLKDIHSVGVALAVDDFGTGYSSLSYLRRYPFDRLKIDRAFVQALGEGSSRVRDIEIVRAIVDLASRLEVDVVAEGIETETEWRLLQSLGCGLGQGFYFSMPVRPEEVSPQLPTAHPLKVAQA